MERIPVESSNLASIGYDPAARLLEVEFKPTHTVYQYTDFPENMWNEFISARSKGQYFASQIKNQWQGRSVRVK